MYADLFGAIPNSSIQRSYNSPFPTDRRPILICTDVTTKNTPPSESNLFRIREHISEVLTECPGNVAIFTPSYNMLGELVDNVNWVPASFRIKMESADMTKQDVTNILSGLGDPGKKTALIAVMGGRFSEGVDYSGGVLSAAITLGLPFLPLIKTNCNCRLSLKSVRKERGVALLFFATSSEQRLTSFRKANREGGGQGNSRGS